MPIPIRLMMVLTVRFGKNGITNNVMNYIARLDPARIRCDLVCPNEPGEEARKAVSRTGGEVFLLGGRNRNTPAYMMKLSQIVRKRGEEIVHAHGNSATLAAEMLAAKRGGAKIRIPHSHNTTCKMKAADKLLRGIFYSSYTHAIACSGAAGDWLYPHRKYVVLNNAIDAERFRFDPAARSQSRERLGIESDTTVFLHIGAFNEQKNQAFLLEAFSLLPNRNGMYKLLLVGDGERRVTCEARAEALGISRRAIFLGLRDDIPALLSAAGRVCAAFSARRAAADACRSAVRRDTMPRFRPRDCGIRSDWIGVLCADRQRGAVCRNDVRAATDRKRGGERIRDTARRRFGVRCIPKRGNADGTVRIVRT